MSAKIDSTPVNLPAAADLSTKKFRFGKLVSGGVDVCSSLGERADGIIGAMYKNSPAAGDGVDFYIDRVPVVETAGTFSRGAQLTTDANGKALEATEGQVVNAIAAEACTAIGQLVRVTRPSITTGSLGALATVSAPGAIPATASHVLLSVDGTDAFTLADGEIGHVLEIECVAAANTPIGTLTIATPYTSEPATHVFRAVGQRLKLLMTEDGWKALDKKRAGALTVVVGTTVLTGEDMVATYNLDVTGTVSSTGTKAIPDGLIEGEEIDIQVTGAASLPSGTVNITAEDADAVAKKDMTAIDGTTSHNAHFRWSGAAWRNTSLTGITLTNA